MYTALLGRRTAEAANSLGRGVSRWTQWPSVWTKGDPHHTHGFWLLVRSLERRWALPSSLKPTERIMRIKKQGNTMPDQSRPRSTMATCPIDSLQDECDKWD